MQRAYPLRSGGETFSKEERQRSSVHRFPFTGVLVPGRIPSSVEGWDLEERRRRRNRKKGRKEKRGEERKKNIEKSEGGERGGKARVEHEQDREKEALSHRRVVWVGHGSFSTSE